MAIFLNGWILHIGGDALGRACVCSLCSRLTIASYSNIMLLGISLFLYWKFSQKNKFYKCFFFNKTLNKS